MVAAVAVLLYFPIPADALFGDSCDFLPEAPKPGWVNNPAWSGAPGLYYGAGEADKRKTEQEQKELSRKKALESLSQKIRVQVQSVLTHEVKSSSTGTREKFEQVVELRSEKRVDEVLRGVKDEDVWLDREKCVLHTLVSISRESVESTGKFSAMARLFEEVKKRSAPRRVQLDLATNALALLEEIDFRYVPEEAGKEHFRRELGKELERVNAEMKENASRTVVAVLTSENAPPALAEKVGDRIRGIVPRSERMMGVCEPLETCLRSAGDDSYGRLVTLKVGKSEEQSGLGGYKGTLRVEATQYDLKSGTVLQGPVAASAQVISWEPDKLDWERALNKIVESGKLSFLTNGKEAGK
ncbi:MAG: LPP20 family lipoprotein [Nitrospinae bacterium]|nr:LPP20 family lipoprotein [Nitrospinota bacterium]